MTFELSNGDLRYFRSTLKSAREEGRAWKEDSVVKSPSDLLAELLDGEVRGQA